VSFEGIIAISSNLTGQFPSPLKGGMNGQFLSIFTKYENLLIIKLAYYQNYCIDFSQILHKVRDH